MRELRVFPWLPKPRRRYLQRVYLDETVELPPEAKAHEPRCIGMEAVQANHCTNVEGNGESFENSCEGDIWRSMGW